MKIIDTITTKAGDVFDIVRGQPDPRLVSIPLRKGRRPTTLPSPVTPHSASTFSDAMKQKFTEPIMAQLYGAGPLFGAFQPDPWDDAVKWIEQRKADEAEWPWPKR